jgi:hypothetical protein
VGIALIRFGWHDFRMPNQSSNDPNVLAFNIVQQSTSEGKNPAAVALGRLGGLKGGNARAKKLSKKRRLEIAHKAAAARWKASKK